MPNNTENPFQKLAEQNANDFLNQTNTVNNLNESISSYSYNAGKNSDAFYKRYKAYGKETFDELGFSPFNKNEKIFNEGTGIWAEYKRSIVHGLAPLFARGFISGTKSLGQMLQGNFKDDPEEAAAYAEASAIASSTKGGLTGFGSNLLTNFGYTAGIITEAIAEELLTLGLSSEYTIFNASKNLTKGLTFVGKAPRVGKGILATESVLQRTNQMSSALRKLDNINEARNYFQSLKVDRSIGNIARNAEKAGKTTSGKIFDIFNPINNTTEAIIDVAKNSKNLTGLEKAAVATYKTVGGLYRDIRNVNMALSEGRLEAGFVRKDTFDHLYDEYRETHNGEAPPEKIQDQMRKKADQAAGSALIANTMLIYATNKVAFDNIMSPKKGITRLLNKKITDVKKNIAGRTVREYTKQTLKSGKEFFTPKLSVIKKGWKGWKGTLQAIKKQGFQKSVTGAIGYTKVNLMEGIQESMQDVIAKTSKDYYVQAFYSEPVSSYFYTEAFLNKKDENNTSFWGHLGEGFQAQVFATNARGEFELDKKGEKQFSGRGLETFLSGFAMGALAGPLNKALPYAQEKIYKIRNKAAYNESKKKLANYNDGMANAVNKIIGSDPLNMYNSRLYNLGTQSTLADEIENPDEKARRDAQEEAVIKQVSQVIEADATDIWLEHLENLKNLTTEEYAEYQKITVEQAEGHTEKIDRIINKTKDIVKNYDEVKEMYPNPINLGDYKKGSVEYQKAALFSKAWDKAVENVVFYNETYKNTLDRMEKVYRAMSSNELIGKIDPLRVQALFDENTLDGEIGMLKTEIEALEGSTDPGSKKQLAGRKESLKALEEFRENYNQFMEHFYKTARYQQTSELEYIESQIKEINAKLKTKPKNQEKVKLTREKQRLEKRLQQFEDADVVQYQEPRKKGYGKSVVKKEESTTKSGDKVTKYTTYAVDENGNEKSMGGGINTTINELLKNLENNNEAFYDEDGNLKYDPNAKIKIEKKIEGSDENGNKQVRVTISSNEIKFLNGQDSIDFLTTTDVAVEGSSYKKDISTTGEKISKKSTSSKKSRLIEISEEYDKLYNEFNELIKDEKTNKIEIERVERRLADLIKEKDDLDVDIESSMDSTNEKILANLEGSFKKYLKTLANQSNETLLEGNIDQAFEMLVDYYRLGNEAQKNAEAINILNDPGGFEDHVNNNFAWMSELWENREDMIKKNITEQTKRVLYNNLLNNLAAQGIYVDLNEFANWKLNGELPIEFYDSINKRVVPKGSILYNEIAAQFIRLDFLSSIEESRKSPEQKLADTVKMLNALENEELSELKQYIVRKEIREVEDKEFTLNSVKDKVGIDQYLEATYTNSEGVKQKVVFYKDKDGNIRFNDANGNVVTKTTDKLQEGKIYTFTQEPDPVEVKAIKDKYDQFRAEAAENSIAETSSVIVEGGEVSIDDLSPDTPIANMPQELREQLKAAFEDYRDDPSNDYLFPKNLTNEELENKFTTFIKSEPAALELIETYIKNKKLEAATSQGTVAPPMITLNNGKKISAENATDAQIQYALKKYNIEIGDIENTKNKSISDEVRLKELKEKYSLLEAYVKSRIKKDLTPEMQNALELIGQLQKEQEKIEPLASGYKIGQKILRRVTNIIQKFLGKKYQYKFKNNITAAFNFTMGGGQSVQDFIDVLKADKLPGFNEDSYNAIADYMNKYINERTQSTTPLSDEQIAQEKARLLEEYNQKAEIIKKDFEQRIFSVGKTRYKNNLAAARDAELEKLKADYDTQIAALEGTEPIDITKDPAFIAELKENTENFIAEQATYQWGRDRGNVIDNLTKKYFSGEKVKPNLNEISQEAFDSLYGRNGIYQSIKDYIDTGDFIVVANGLVVYDEEANAAGEIDLLLVDKKGNFTIVDIKTGEKTKWDGYNNEQNSNYAKQIENTYQQMVYARLLKNMFGIDAKIAIIPIETTTDIATSKILTAKRPSAPTLLETDKIVFPLNPTQEMYDKLNAEIPETAPKFNGTVPSDNVDNITNDPNLDDVKNTDYENEGDNEQDAPKDEGDAKAFGELKAKISKATFEELGNIVTELSLNNLKYSADQMQELINLIEARSSELEVTNETEEGEIITYNVGDEVYSESDIFTSTNRKFLSANQTAIITEISEDRITIKPQGKRTKMEMSVEEFKKKFKASATLFSGQPSTGPVVDVNDNVTQDSSDATADLLNNPARQSEIEKKSENQDTKRNLYEDLDC